MFQEISQDTLAEQLQQAVKQACQRIAPSWPLDKAIAVNPWWQLRHQPIVDVATNMAALGRINCLMPPAYYQGLWQRQIIQPEHLSAAAAEFGSDAGHAKLLAQLDISQPNDHWINVSDWLDAHPENRHKIAWHDEITHQISQFCALYCQYPQWMQNTGDADNDFYSNWLAVIRQDRGVEILTAETHLHRLFLALPETAEQVFENTYAALCPAGTSPELFADYCYALLLDIHGWASWTAYLTWQANFNAQSNAIPEQLLAVRLAWDWVVWQHTKAEHPETYELLKEQFCKQFSHLETLRNQWRQAQQHVWIWQRALELSFQMPLQQKLLNYNDNEKVTPKLQAFFCIDVRSEPFRRALEAQDFAIQTFGFAGFFGLPIDYAPIGSGFVRPQLPGLLNASIRAVPINTNAPIGNAVNKIKGQVFWQKVGDASASSLGLVEAKGLWKAFDLLKNSLFPSAPLHGINQLSHDGDWQLRRHDSPLSVAEQAELVAGILGAMGLTESFAETVLLAGHGSCSANNPQAAGLDCGACGGQTGEINVKVLAQLLNDAPVRAALSQHGIDIPQQTRFIACLHNTTTDAITCFGQADDSQHEWHDWLVKASQLARENRLASVRTDMETEMTQEKFYRQKSHDWGQVRPEWGLANNAAFIVAPRARTQDIDLEGRSFLHDYQWQTDKDFKILELIMTAPMVVTNWINLQYYASVTDNLKYGSGNKLLHNVVGGNIGVFEGNGGDLRIGLSLQSLHDGQDWRHQPIRLGVYIAAPREAMANIIEKHAAIADLISNQWLFLFQLDDSNQCIWQFAQGQWRKTAKKEA